MDAPGDASILKSSVRQVHSCVAAALQVADGDTRTGPELRGTQEVQLVYPRPFALALPPSLPRRPAQALSDPGKLFSWQLAVGAWFLLHQQRPGGPRRWPAATSFGGLVASASPVPRRFAHRTTDMAPMLRHADPCRASPCRPRCLLSALNRARPRSRALNSPVRRLPKRSRLRACSASSPRFPSPCCSAIFSTPVSAAHKAGDASNASFLTLAAPCGAAMPNSATAKRRPLPPGCAPATHCRSPVFTATNVGRDAASASASAASFTLDEGLDADRRQHSWPSFSRLR